jgi:glycosyltransferase involved in cell wall biosynthesis
MTRVVSVTSISVERDSRTYKFAASAARLGYESIVVEGETSAGIGREAPFELISPEQAREELEPPPPLPGPTPFHRITEALPPRLRGAFSLLTRGIDRRIVLPARASIYTLRLGLHDFRRRNALTASLLPDAEIYWLRSFHQFPSVYSKARHLKARFLYDTPDAYWEPPGLTPAPTRAHRLLLRRFERVERRAVRRAERFTTVSGGLVELLERRFGRRGEVIRNAHDLRLDQRPDRDLREVTGVGPDDFLLVMTGNRKDGLTFKEALEAMKMLPERVHIAFLGRNHELSRPLVEEAGLSRRVHLPQPVPPTQVVEFISSADASPILLEPLTPSYYYSLPNGFFHAIAAGLPILYPPLPEMRALAAEHDVGLEIEPKDPNSIAAGVRALSEDPDRAARHRAGSERARQVLNWEREERIIADILGAPAGVRSDNMTATLPR